MPTSIDLSRAGTQKKKAIQQSLPKVQSQRPYKEAEKLINQMFWVVSEMDNAMKELPPEEQYWYLGMAEKLVKTVETFKQTWGARRTELKSTLEKDEADDLMKQVGADDAPKWDDVKTPMPDFDSHKTMPNWDDEPVDDPGEADTQATPPPADMDTVTQVDPPFSKKPFQDVPKAEPKPPRTKVPKWKDKQSWRQMYDQILADPNTPDEDKLRIIRKAGIPDAEAELARRKAAARGDVKLAPRKGAAE